MEHRSDSFVHQSFRTKLIAKAGASLEVRAELELLGCARALVLTSASLEASTLVTQIAASLEGKMSYVEGKVPRHSSVAAVSRIARMAAESRSDCIVSIGGGSVCDTAKAVAVALAEGEPLEQHATRFVPGQGFITPSLRRPKLPIISIPMTASGAEVTPSFGVRASDAKLLFWDPGVASQVILLDAAASTIVPKEVMLTSGMNGLAHCVEALYAKRRSPLSTMLARQAVPAFIRAMGDVAGNPYATGPRHELLVAGHIGGIVLASAGSCLHHAICHVLGAMTGASHGDLNSVILPHAVRFNAPYAKAELEALTPITGDLGDALQELQRRTGVPVRLRDLGVEVDLLGQAAAKVLHERGTTNNPRPVQSPAEIHALLLRAW